jgi:hypothetical protein
VVLDDITVLGSGGSVVGAGAEAAVYVIVGGVVLLFELMGRMGNVVVLLGDISAGWLDRSLCGCMGSASRPGSSWCMGAASALSGVGYGLGGHLLVGILALWIGRGTGAGGRAPQPRRRLGLLRDLRR